MNDLMIMGCSTVGLHQTNLHCAFFGSVILISPKNHGSPCNICQNYGWQMTSDFNTEIVSTNEYCKAL